MSRVRALWALRLMLAIGLIAIPTLPRVARAGSASVCGDGVIEGTEQCDDTGTTSGDGCSALCRIEACFDCTGEPSLCTPSPNGAPCDDLNACTSPDACDVGICVSGPTISCPAPGQCRVAVCDPITGCGTAPSPNGTPCEDANPDTSPDTCQSGTCQGTPLASCTGRPNGASCNDGNACTNGDSCFSGACRPGMPITCTALDSCHAPGVCSPITGCNNPPRPAGTPCDDGNACTTSESCNGSGVCTSSETPCGDGALGLQCGEQCDDGNTTSGDGCSSACVIDRSVVQTSLQERCINEVIARDAGVAMSQGMVSSDCVHDAGLGHSTRLGNAGETLTATACLGNDVKNRVGKALAKLATGVQTRCSASAQIPFPYFALTDPTSMGAVAQAEPRALNADLFGPNLSSAIVLSATDSKGARCQSELAKRTAALYDELWRRTVTRTREALLCSRTRAPANCAAKGIVPLPVGNGFEHQLAVIGYIQADPKSFVQKKVNAIRDQAIRYCDPAPTPIAALAPGVCSGAADAATLASCVTRETRCRFCRNLAYGHAELVDCDKFDDGLGNASCDLKP